MSDRTLASKLTSALVAQAERVASQVPQDARAFHDALATARDLADTLDLLDEVRERGVWFSLPAQLAVVIHAVLAGQRGARFLQVRVEGFAVTWEVGTAAFACRIHTERVFPPKPAGTYTVRADLLPHDLPAKVQWARYGAPVALPALPSRGTCTASLRSGAWVNVDARYRGGTDALAPELLLAAGELVRVTAGSGTWKVSTGLHGQPTLAWAPLDDAAPDVHIELMSVADAPELAAEARLELPHHLDVPKSFGGVAFCLEEVERVGFEALVQGVALNLSRRTPGKRPLSVWVWRDEVIGGDGGFAGEALMLGLSNGNAGSMQALCRGAGIEPVHRETYYRDSEGPLRGLRALLVQHAAGEVVRALRERKDGTIGHKDPLTGAFVEANAGTETAFVNGDTLVVHRCVIDVC